MKTLYECEDVRIYLVDVEESKHLSHKSHKKIETICPNCHMRRYMRVERLTTYPYFCPYCSVKRSYGERAFKAYSDYFSLGFKEEVIFDDLKHRRFDFVKDNLIVEINGCQHYNDKEIWYEEARKQDEEKRLYCEYNEYTLIEINMSVSSWENFVSEINKIEELPSINKEVEEELLNIIKNRSSYPINGILSDYNKGASYRKIANKYGIGKSTVGKLINQHKNIYK